MQAATACALMLKARKVFANEQTFLSFPVAPLPFAPRQLDFFRQEDAAAVRDSLRHRKDFSVLVDAVPTGEAWQPAGPARLSEVYRSILDAAVVAKARSPGDEARYQAARAVLRTGPRESDKLLAYRRCRDAWLVAQQRFDAARLTAESADGLDKLDWQHLAPRLRAELAELQRAWLLDGFKEEVEAAQALLATLAATSPALAWSDWLARCNSDIDAITDPADGSSVLPSGFSPSNAVAEGAWRDFALTPAEVTALLEEAPAAWRDTLLAGAPPRGTEALTFEFSSAAVLRPWFDPALFKARFWRFAEPGRRLSDGAVPPAGECPAYVAGLVFARRISADGSGTPAGLGFGHATGLPRGRVVPRPVSPADDPELLPGEVPPHLRDRRRAAAFAATHRAAHPAAASAGHAPSLAVFEQMRSERAADRLAATATSALATADEPVYVLAFICKPLALCPHPDPELAW
jgi:hypothetical protein